MKWASAGGDGGGVGIRVGGGVRWGGVPCLRVTQTHAGQEPISLLFQRQWENHGGGRFYDPNQTTFLHCHLFFPRGVFFFFLKRASVKLLGLIMWNIRKTRSFSTSWWLELLSVMEQQLNLTHVKETRLTSVVFAEFLGPASRTCWIET